MGIKEIQPSGWYYFSKDIQNHFLLIARLLAFLIILIVAYIFYRFFYQELRVPAHTNTSTTTFGITLQTRRAKPALVGLDATSINSLPILIHRSSGSGDGSSITAFGQSECSICLGIFEDKEMVKVMPKCHHAFHCVCVDTWLREQCTCPVCRETIVSSSEAVTA